MIGLGVGIDYALFILTRFREIYRENGGDVQEAVALAMDTAGRAVLFAGATVVIALLGMFALGVSFLYGLAIAASLAVLFVLTASITLLPALLTFFGRRVGEPGRLARRFSRRRRPEQPRLGFWTRWIGAIQRHPALAAAAATALMLTLARPLSGCASARATPATTRPRSRPGAPTTCSRRASAPASTARSPWSSSCRTHTTPPRCASSAPPSPRPATSPRSRRRGSAPPATPP